MAFKFIHGNPDYDDGYLLDPSEWDDIDSHNKVKFKYESDEGDILEFGLNYGGLNNVKINGEDRTRSFSIWVNTHAPSAAQRVFDSIFRLCDTKSIMALNQIIMSASNEEIRSIPAILPCTFFPLTLAEIVYLVSVSEKTGKGIPVGYHPDAVEATDRELDQLYITAESKIIEMNGPGKRKWYNGYWTYISSTYPVVSLKLRSENPYRPDMIKIKIENLFMMIPADEITHSEKSSINDVDIDAAEALWYGSDHWDNGCATKG